MSVTLVVRASFPVSRLTLEGQAEGHSAEAFAVKGPLAANQVENVGHVIHRVQLKILIIIHNEDEVGLLLRS